MFSFEISVVFCEHIIHPIKNHRYSDESIDDKKTRVHWNTTNCYTFAIARDVGQFRLSLSAADTTVGISCMLGYFSSPYLRDDDRCRTFSFSFTLPAYIPHGYRAFLYPLLSFLPSTIQPEAIAGAIPTSYWLRLGELVRVRRSAVGRTFAIPANASYVVSMEMKRHRRHTKIISPSSIVPRAHNNFSTSLYHSARNTSLGGHTMHEI